MLTLCNLPFTCKNSTLQIVKAKQSMRLPSLMYKNFLVSKLHSATTSFKESIQSAEFLLFCTFILT